MCNREFGALCIDLRRLDYIESTNREVSGGQDTRRQRSKSLGITI
jgi:hypothetical protein